MDIETKRQSTQALLDSAELLFNEAECRAALQKVADAISHDLSDKYPLLLPVMGGAVVFTGQLLPLLRFPLDFDYVHVSRYGDKLQGGNFNWLRMPNPEQIAGRCCCCRLSGFSCPNRRPICKASWKRNNSAFQFRTSCLAKAVCLARFSCGSAFSAR